MDEGFERITGLTEDEAISLNDEMPPFGDVPMPDAPPDGPDGDDGDDEPVSLDDFYCDMKSGQFIYTPARELWPARSVNARLPAVTMRDANGEPILDDRGKPKKVPASNWLATNRPVEQMTWGPGEPLVIRDKLIAEGGWIDRNGASVFNLYREPKIGLGDASKASPYLEHLKRVYPTDWGHIAKWLAHRRQRPADKLNHALVLGGSPGIGKDTILEPAKEAVGPWNVHEVSPKQMMGRFNGFARSVILRVSEARNLGDTDRFTFYEVMKTYIAAPPNTVRVDEKNLREYHLPNCCGVVITTNYKTNGIHLPADDRRHYVAWSDLTKEDFDPDYFPKLYGWFYSGGFEHVAAYLDQLDISDFDPKAPPPKTEAFWAIVQSNRSSEDADLEDMLDDLGRPEALPLSLLTAAAKGEFAEWVKDARNRRAIPHKLETCGYSIIHNSAAKDGYWRISGRRQPIYGRKDLDERTRLAAVRSIIAQNSEPDWSTQM